VCLTFDDGYVDNFEIAAPLLEMRGLRGTFYITAGAVQARQPLWYDRAAATWTTLGGQEIRERIREDVGVDASACQTRESWIQWLKVASNDRRKSIMAVLETGVKDGALPCPLMTADQVRQLAERGHEIGSHTLWHPILTTMAENERRHEIEGARELLQEWTEREVTGFCYPNGDLDADVVRQLKDAGHSYACTTRPGRNHEATDLFQLRRIDVTPDRVASTDGSFDTLGLRAEISLFRERLRRWMPSGRNSQ
jgi:peptidoglycan/xylan/chitin deacetylase (PgdA/CDA1 family)